MNKYLILFVVMMFLFIGCDVTIAESPAEQKQQTQTNQLLDEANRQMGLPNVVNFQQKKL